MKKTAFITFVLAIALLSGCSVHKVDTLEKVCESSSGVDLGEKYRPFWAVVFAVRFDGEGVRDNIVQILNDAYMKKVNGRASRMVWRTGKTLHVYALSNLFVLDKNTDYLEWATKVTHARDEMAKDAVGGCLFGTIDTYFDRIDMHFMDFDPYGRPTKKYVRPILTDRAQLAKTDPNLP